MVMGGVVLARYLNTHIIRAFFSTFTLSSGHKQHSLGLVRGGERVQIRKGSMRVRGICRVMVPPNPLKLQSNAVLWGLPAIHPGVCSLSPHDL